jgi:hypothetical protein
MEFHEELVLYEFCDAYRNGDQFDQQKLYEALCGLGYGKRKLDHSHNQFVECARRGCGHAYEKHFDPYEDNREVGCKYCGYKCPAFAEP